MGIEPLDSTSSEAPSWKKMVSPSLYMNWANCNHQETFASCLWVVLKPKTGILIENSAKSGQ
jgi:hypothetical protein